jgi:putative zinc finger/helix-turn-helix YgiT family protein
MMKETRGRLKLPINGEEIPVPAAAHLKCPKCGEIILRFQDAKRLHEDAIAIYRRKHGLLSADEIRAIRERFDLKQTDLARLLRLGANTVSRWESGRNVQIAAMDTLLRLIRDLPGSIDYLRPRRSGPSEPRLGLRHRRTKAAEPRPKSRTRVGKIAS